MRGHVTLLNVRVDSISGDELLDSIKQTVTEHKKQVFAYLTAHALNVAQRDTGFTEFLNDADVTFADGEGVRLGAKILGTTLPPRIPLTRWIWTLAEFCARHGFSVYLLGATEENVSKAAQQLKARFPTLKLSGYHHGYFDKFGNESTAVCENINALKPNILLVGFGMPMQERWIQLNKERLNVNAILTAGSCFDFVAGAMPSAPRWLSETGMEWLFRLLLEPARLFTRYIVGNPLFIGRVVLQRLKNGKTT